MEYKTLDQICDIVSGGTPSRSHSEYWNGNIPWVKISDIASKYVTRTEESITQDGLDNSSAKMLKKGTILYTIFATLGTVGILDIDACTNQAIAGLTIKDSSVIMDYLYYYLKSTKTMVARIGRGVAQNNINLSILKKFSIPIPDLTEQVKIVNILKQTEFIIQKRRTQIDDLDELVKSRFVEMFGDPITNTKKWKTIVLAEACDGIGDGLHGTPEYDNNGQYPFINGNNLENGKIVITSSTKRVNYETYMKHYISIGDNAILLSINGTLGKIACYKGEKVMLGKSACYCNLKPNVNRIFVYGVMSSDFFSQFLENNATKSTIKNVSLKAIRSFKLINPPLGLQNQFSSFVHQVNKSKSDIQRSLNEAQQLFDSLMQKYFS